MTYTQIRVTSEDRVVSAVVWVPSWSVCSLKEGDRIRLQATTAPYSNRAWTVVGFGVTQWTVPQNEVALPQPVDSKECPVWQR